MEQDKEHICSFIKDKWDALKQNKIKSYAVFTEEYIPPKILHRDTYINKILENIHFNQNMLLTGLPAVGKTLLMKYIFSQMRQITEEVCFFYTNCRDKHKGQIYTEMIEALGGVSKPLGYSMGVYEEKLLKNLKIKGYEKMVICLDEYDLLAKKYKPTENFLYFFGDYSGIFTVILITNKVSTEWYGELTDTKTKDRLQLMKGHLHFNRYNRFEIKDILQSRVELGLGPEMLSEEELQIIADITYDHENSLRTGIKTLVKIAENKHQIERKLDKYEIEALFDNTKTDNIIHTCREIEDKYKFLVAIIVKLIKDKKDPSVVNIHEYWQKNHQGYFKPKSEKSIRAYLDYLLEFGIVHEERADSKKTGRKQNLYVPNFDIGLYSIKIMGEDND